jgi:hypothetical protein
VQVQVLDGLASVRIGVDHDAVTRLGKSVIPGDPGGEQHQASELNGVVSIVERGDVSPRDHNEVRRRLRIDVAERDRVIGKSDDVRGYLAVHNSAEEALSDFLLSGCHGWAPLRLSCHSQAAG